MVARRGESNVNFFYLSSSNIFILRIIYLITVPIKQ